MIERPARRGNFRDAVLASCHVRPKVGNRRGYGKLARHTDDGDAFQEGVHASSSVSVRIDHNRQGTRLLGFRPLLLLHQPLDALLRAIDHALSGMADHHLADVPPLAQVGQGLPDPLHRIDAGNDGYDALL